jgi:hypothetical protein
MRKTICFAFMLLLWSVSASAQVTIGSDREPQAGAGLDLSGNKGLLLPNVALSNIATDFQLEGGEGNKTTGTGMMVYNTSSNLNGPGIYVWDGERWKTKIAIECADAPAAPTLTVTAINVNLQEAFTLSCADVSDGSTTYKWNLPDGLTPTGSSNTHTITVTGTVTGTYTADQISVTATNACGSTTATGTGENIWVTYCTGSDWPFEGKCYYFYRKDIASGSCPDMSRRPPCRFAPYHVITFWSSEGTTWARTSNGNACNTSASMRDCIYSR